MDKTICLFPALMILILYHVHLIDEYIVKKQQPASTAFHIKALDFIFKLAILFSCWMFQLPVFLLYILLFLSYNITFCTIYRESKPQFFFWTYIHFIIIMSLHLICLSAVSLLSAQSLRDTYLDKGSCLLVMILTVGLMNLIEYVFLKKDVHKSIRIMTSDTVRFRQLIHFEWYAAVYLLFDSIPCAFYLPYDILSVFLIGSCILLFLQMLLFLLYTCRIIEKAHYEAEYYRLEQERSNHVKKEMELQKLAYMDSLTGTFTRRFAMQMLESMQKDLKRVAIAYIDVNGLKKINDTLGHNEGDRYLIAIANSLNQGLQKNDVLARIGGDEFLIVSPDTSEKDLGILLENINQAAGQTKIGGFTPSFSFGTAESVEGSGFNIEALLQESDRRMYAYKTEYKKGER